MRLTNIMLASVSAVIALPAMAQVTTPAEPAEAATSEQNIADIVVTATRRSERLSNIPIAVSAVNSDALRSSGANDIRGLALLQTWGTAARRHPVGGLGSIGEMLIEHNHGFGQGRGSNSECSFNQAHLPHDTWLQAPCLGLSFA